MKDGIGCNMPAEADRSGGKPVPDQHLNEHATCYVLKDRGLVVISSCGHTGIVNSTRQAMKVSGVNKVHAILGGSISFPPTMRISSRPWPNSRPSIPMS